MTGRRDSASTIWRTVVFAGAMLGCGGSPSSSHPAAPAAPTPPPAADPAPAPAPTPAVTESKPDPAAQTPQNADPCNGVVVPAQTAQPNPDPVDDPPPPPKGKRPRGGGDRPTGRGFVLA